MLSHNEKLKLAMAWFEGATPEEQKRAVEQLFDHAISTDWVNVWDLDDREELAEEEGRPVEDYAVPYFTTCGEPISSNFGK